MQLTGRVVKLDRGFPLVQSDVGAEFRCKHSTALVKGEKLRAVIGDRVVAEVSDSADMAQILEIEPRRNVLVRKDPTERAVAQVLAANFETIIIAHALTDLNIRRLERELVLAHETGAHVVVVLTKSDLVGDEKAAELCCAVESIVADGVGVLVVSEPQDKGLDALRECIPPGTTAVLIGRSGVGKSSLVNALAGHDIQRTGSVREGDGKGRHTTVSRAIIAVAQGGWIVDMPGIRGLGLWESEEGLAAAFPDITALTSHCRFRDCTHTTEPGCAVTAAVEAGILRRERVESYLHLKEENDRQNEKSEEARRMHIRAESSRRR